VRIRKSKLYEFALDRKDSPPSISPHNEDAVGDSGTFTGRYDISLAGEEIWCDDSGRDEG
jgi:hypothetical protein